MSDGETLEARLWKSVSDELAEAAALLRVVEAEVVRAVPHLAEVPLQNIDLLDQSLNALRRLSSEVALATRPLTSDRIEPAVSQISIGEMRRRLAENLGSLSDAPSRQNYSRKIELF